MLIDLQPLSVAQTYFTMTQTVLPRPIAWILSANDNASYNLAPFSYFNAVSSAPPLLAVSIGLQDDGSEKDTLRNLRARGESVVHIASCSQLAELNQSSATLPPQESEVSAGDLALSPVAGFNLPRLRDCKVAFMCRTHQIIEIGHNKQHLVLAEVDAIYVDDACTETNDKGRVKILADKIAPLARLGASEYASFGQVMALKRPL